MTSHSLFMVCFAMFLPVAASAAEGLNLSWDDCGSNGVSAKTFACNVTTGTDVLVASMRAPAGITRLKGVEGQIDIRSSATNLPDWWKHNSSPLGGEALACRGNAGLEVDLETDFQSCEDAWDTEARLSHDYDIGFMSPNRARLRVIVDIAPIERALTAGLEYLLFRVNLHHNQATGAGSCTGCSTSACIVFNEAKLTNGSSVVAVNATADAATIMLEAIRDHGGRCGFKAAGGIRSLADAARYFDLADRILGAAWATPDRFRIGASSLIDEVLAVPGETGIPSGGSY